MSNIEPTLHIIRAAIGYLCRMQDRDGHWEDYQLPVGRSDAWVTGYVGFALAEAIRLKVIAGADLPDAQRAARDASEWLRGKRAYSVGWGYNSHTGPDADSTAWVLRLSLCLDVNIDQRDVQFLLSKLRANGGFATYDGPGHWGTAQPDVTPVVFLGLPRDYRSTVEQQVVAYLRSTRASDGTWPSYWWRTCHYSTFLNVELFDALGLPDAHILPVVSEDQTHGIHSAFDLACVTGIAAIQSSDTRIIGALSNELMHLQRQEGMWPGAANLRVTDPTCAQPWINPAGRLYKDSLGLITTATAVRALTRVISCLYR